MTSRCGTTAASSTWRWPTSRATDVSCTARRSPATARSPRPDPAGDESARWLRASSRRSRPSGARSQPPRRVDMPVDGALPAPVVVGLVLHRHRPRPLRPRRGRRRAPLAVPRPMGKRHAAAHGVRRWTTDVGSRRIWRSKRNPLAPRDVDTSCITQPPVARDRSRRVAAALPEPDRGVRCPAVPEARRLPLVAVPRARPDHSGLVTLIHPWECGLDTTPPWMRQLARHAAAVVAAAARGRLARLLRRLRYDTRHLPAVDDRLTTTVCACSRSSTSRSVTISISASMPPDRSVLIEDIAFNAMLIAANRSLGAATGRRRPFEPTQLTDCFRHTETALEDLWDEASGQYYSRTPSPASSFAPRRSRPSSPSGPASSP